MPRRTSALGQGLDALVSGSNHLALEPQGALPAPGRATLQQWEYACLTLRKKGRKSRLWLSERGPSAIVRPRRAVVADGSPWAALVLLGGEGWELVGILPGAFYLKRPLLIL